jgi:ATP-dependent DNA ligase
MTLELRPPIAPMEALPVETIPAGPEWQYEPKWDGFRCLAFRDGDDVRLQSKAGRPLNRYFPEVAEALGALKARAFVLDGELAVPADGGFSFDALLQRIHPAASRVKRLAAETPAIFIAFDLLAAADGRSLTASPLQARRHQLDDFAHRYFPGHPSLRLSPATHSLAQAAKWLKQAGPALDGIIAKRSDAAYRPGERTAMQKIKNYRSADCVVGGFRYGADGTAVGSLLLGLYDDDGLLHHVGFTSGIRANERQPLGDRAHRRMEAAQAQAGGGSLLRSLQRRTLPPRHAPIALSPRQGATPMHDGPDPPRRRQRAAAFERP